MSVRPFKKQTSSTFWSMSSNKNVKTWTKPKDKEAESHSNQTSDMTADVPTMHEARMLGQICAVPAHVLKSSKSSVVHTTRTVPTASPTKHPSQTHSYFESDLYSTTCSALQYCTLYKYIYLCSCSSTHRIGQSQNVRSQISVYHGGLTV